MACLQPAGFWGEQQAAALMQSHFVGRDTNTGTMRVIPPMSAAAGGWRGGERHENGRRSRFLDTVPLTQNIY